MLEKSMYLIEVNEIIDLGLILAVCYQWLYTRGQLDVWDMGIYRDLMR